MGGDYYWWYKNHGICTNCHKEKAYKHQSLCLECRLKRLSREQERRVNMSEVDREKEKARRKISCYNLYHKRKESGICVDCGKRTPVKGVRCEMCRKLNNYRRLKPMYLWEGKYAKEDNENQS